jgi:hypothetical protein
MSEKLVAFGKVSKPVIVHETVVQFSPKAYDFIARHTVHGGPAWKGWQATKVQFDILINNHDKMQFSNARDSR